MSEPAFNGRVPERRDFLASWATLLRRRWGWSAGAFAVVMGLALAIVLLSRPVYQAESRLRLGEPPPMSGVSPNAGVFSFLRLGGDPFSNDLELLSSRTLAEGVVRDVALSVQLMAPRGFHRDSVLASLAIGDSTTEATFEVSWTEATRVTVQRTAPTDSTVGSFPTGVPVTFAGVRAVFRERRAGGPETVRVKTVPFGEAVRVTSGRLRVTRTRREANVLEVAYAELDPGVAQAVVSAAVRNFLQLRTDLMQRESAETVDSLRTVARETEAELRAAEDAIEELQRTSGLVAPDAQSEALIQRYEESLALLETGRAELRSLGAQLDQVAQTDDRVEAWTTLVAHPRFLENLTVGEMVTRLTELEGERTVLRARRTAESREVRIVDAQIQQLDGALRTIATEFRGALEAQVQDLDGRVASMEELLGAIPAQVLELGRRQRNARVLAELLIITEQRLRQEELRQALTFSNVQVIDPPSLLFRPIWPRKKLGTAVGFLIAVGFGLFAAVVLERADGSVRTAAEIRLLTGAPVLAAGVVGRGAPSLTAEDATAIRRAAARDGNGRLTIASVCDGTDPVPVIEALSALGEGDFFPATLSAYSAAAAAASDGAQVVLLVRAGRTRREQVSRAVRLVEDAGGRIAGTIVAGDGAGDVRAVWL